MLSRIQPIRLLAAAAIYTLGYGLAVNAQAQGQPLTPAVPGSAPSPVNPSRDIGLDQKLNAQVPLDTMFRDENGKPVPLGTYFGKRPVVLVLVWYKCPGICGVELEGMVRAFQQQKFQLGKDYDAVTISINPHETPELAAAKKHEYIDILGRPGSENGWHFLTGDEPSIKRVANAIGYRYVYDPKSQQYAHPAGILIITPQGRISRYFYGIDYKARDLRLGLVEASKSRIGNAVDSVLLLCYHYDPTTGRYSLAILNIMRWAGLLTLVIIGGFIWMLSRFERKRSAQQAAQLAENTQPHGA